MDLSEFIHSCDEDGKKERCEETPAKKANRLQLPLIPRRPPSPLAYGYNPSIAVCEECGHEVKVMDMRSCPLGNCPLGGTTTLN
jgi:hypothetical protein